MPKESSPDSLLDLPSRSCDVASIRADPPESTCNKIGANIIRHNREELSCETHTETHTHTHTSHTQRNCRLCLLRTCQVHQC